MHLCCPACGFKSPIETFAADKDARHFAALMGCIPPPLADITLRYLSLFAPAKHAMTFSKGRAVLEPLVGMIEQGRISRAKREWVVNLAQFEQGLQQMVDRRASLTLPLKSHGYLLEIIGSDADKIEAKAEAGDILRARSGATRQAAADVAGTEAAQWDEGRRQQAQRLAALQALTSELTSVKKLGIPYSDDTLIAALLAQGHARAHIDFALSKRPPA